MISVKDLLRKISVFETEIFLFCPEARRQPSFLYTLNYGKIKAT